MTYLYIVTIHQLGSVIQSYNILVNISSYLKHEICIEFIFFWKKIIIRKREKKVSEIRNNVFVENL